MYLSIYLLEIVIVWQELFGPYSFQSHGEGSHTGRCVVFWEVLRNHPDYV